MKLIQILVLVAATAAGAAAQNTGSSNHTPGPGTQTGNAAKPAVKLIVPKPGAPSSAPAHKPNGTPAVSNAKSAVKPKPPVLTVKPAQNPAANAKSTTLAAKKPPAKTESMKKPTQVMVVPQKPNNAKPAANVEESNAGAANRRDPFVSIVRASSPAMTGSNCSVGKRCLFIPELELKGIAKDTDGQMMAVVVSNTKRAYFLRENDQVFNGSVQKITSDSVTFREFATDHLGRETAHEVVKKLPKS